MTALTTDHPDPGGRTPSARMRILGWYVALLAVSLVAALLLQRAFLLAQVSSDADEALDQEVAELRLLAGGTDPVTGEPFGGDVAAIFDVFLSRNVPAQGGAVVTLIDGRAYKTDLSGEPLARSDELVGLWAAHQVPARGEVETDLGPVRYLVVPISAGDDMVGTFVVATFLRGRLDAVNDVVRLGALVYGSIFFLASALAWVVAGGVLRPLRTLSETVQSINESDLSRRIPVDGDDEIARLGLTFNAMLDRLEEAFDTQRRFVDDAGHELRTPITVIRGNLEVMGDDPDDRAQTVALVTDELDRMARIVDDLLLLAKSEQADFVNPLPIDLGEFLDDILAKAGFLDDRPWSIGHRDEVVVVGDEQRLTQAMMNLVRNAIEHTPAGTPVTIGGTVADDRVALWVHDEGPGIPETDRERLFERFARGAGRKRASDGAGLGLAIVAAIAEGHGGTVEVHGGPGSGTTIVLRIPLEPTRMAS